MTSQNNPPEWVKTILFDLVLASIPMLLVRYNPMGEIIFANPALEKLFGYSPGELLGKSIAILVPKRLHRSHALHMENFTRAPESRLKGKGRNLYGLRKDGTEFPIEVVLTPKSTDLGKHVLVEVTDITERKRIDQKRLKLLLKERQARKVIEQTKWKDTFLSDVSRVLSKSLDYQTIFKNVAEVIVPRFSDWRIVGLLQENNAIQIVPLAADISKLNLVQQLANFSPDPSAPEGLQKAIRTGQSFLYSRVTEKDLSHKSKPCPLIGTRDPHSLLLLRELGLKSYIVVPIFVRNKTIGAIALASTQKSYTLSDLETARELGYRCSLAIENASLYQDAQMATQVREEFLSIASHELNTPLTSLAMQIQMLNRYVNRGILSSIPREKLLEMTKISEQQVRRFTSLINDLLDVSRIAAGHLVINVEDVNLSDLVRDTIDRHREELKGAHCSTDIKIMRSIIGSWDRTRIEQVVTNLLTNAMKYGAGKPIEIWIQQDKGNAKLIVRDHGIGISKEDQIRIFQQFERAVSIKEFGGLGLGLFIVRQIIQAHGGTIQVESELGRGSAFIVELPLKGDLSV